MIGKSSVTPNAYSKSPSLCADAADDGAATAMAAARHEDPVEYVRSTEAYCFCHLTFAEKYLDAIFAEAVDILAPRQKSYRLPDIVIPILNDIVDGIAPQRSAHSLRRDFFTASQSPSWSNVVKDGSARKVFSGWPKVSEFNIKLGLEKLEEYVETWERSKEWMCYVEFLGFESEENGNYFIYEVEFSTPTPAYPVPQATASVYFSLEVSKILPPSHDRPVQVSYLFESTNVIHIPGKIDFQESWISDIIQCKLHVFKYILF